MGRLAVWAFAGLAALGPPAVKSSPDAWAEAAAYFQQYSASRKPDERASAASRISAGMDGKHDKMAATLLLGLLTSELARDDSGKREDQVSSEVLKNCESSLKKTSTGDAVEVLIREAKKGRSLRVRFYLARSLGAVKIDAAARALAELAEDKDPVVVVGVAGGLRDRGDQAAVEIALKILKRKDCPWEAAILSLDALEKTKSPEKSMDGLIEVLESQRDAGRVRVRLLDALGKLSGLPEPWGEDAAWWKDAWAAKKESKDAPKIDAPATEPSEFYGFKIRSHRVIFLLDGCGVMDGGFSRAGPAPNKMPDPKKPDDPKKGGAKKGADALEEAAKARAEESRRRLEGRPARKKMDDLKREFAAALCGLDPRVSFGVIWYDTETRAWKDDLVPATWQNKAACLQDVEKIIPNGANGTNFWNALETALRFAATAQKPDVVQQDRKADYATVLRGVDTLYLISGGHASTGRFVTTGIPEIEVVPFMSEVEKVLALRPIVVNTVAMGDPEGEKDWMSEGTLRFIQKLADVTGGQFNHMVPGK